MCANTEARTATPNTPPSSRMALFAPDALPSCSAGTEPRTTFATGVKKRAIPPPERMNGSTRCEYGVPVPVTAAIQINPADWRASPTVITRWPPPSRSRNAPAIGAMKIGIAVHGRMRRPDCSGDIPCTVWKNCASRKIEPNIPKNIRSEATFAAVNVRLRKKRSGSIGAGARSSQSTNNASTIAPPASAPTISGLAQPTWLPRTRPQTIPSRPALARPSPGRSSASFGPRLSRRRSAASGISASPIGTLSQKIHCQEMPSTTAPPTSGPIATARPLIPPHAPRTRPRRLAGTAELRIVSVSGVTMAPPRPCTARAAIRTSIEGARAAAAEASVKIPRPITNRRRRPKRSPSAAPVMSSTAKVSV